MGVLRSDRVSGLGGGNAINGSAFFPQNSYINIEPDSGLDLSGDFTVEMWVRILAGESMGNNARQISSRNYYVAGSDGNWYFGLNHYSSGEILFYSYDGQGSSESVAGNIATPDNDRWYHIAAARSGSTLKVFLDGSEEGSGTLSKGLDDGGNNGLFIGGESQNSGTNSYGDSYGWISNLRIIKGRALYTADFTVPTGRLEKTSDTVLLCFQSPGNVLEEKTGKILSHNNHDTTGASKEVSADRLAPDVGEDYGTTFADGAVFDTLSYMVPPGGTTTQSNRGRGVFGGGYYEPGAGAANLSSIEYFNIQSTGNSIDFGDRTIVGHGLATLSSSTRGVMMGGRAYHYPSAPTANQTNIIDYVTIATTANAQDFGDMVDGVSYIFAAASNATRGIISKGGSTDMSYVTIATLGNSVDTGGDSTIARNTFTGFASPTRAIFAGGGTPSAINNIDYVTIASLGDAVNFGDLTFTGACQGASSETRGIIFTGGFPSAASNVIDFITIASAGDATDFGDLPANITSHSAGSGVSNSIRAVRCAGYVAPAATNRIDYVTIATTGNASDFGDMIQKRFSASGFSDSHGGIA